jgi:hypothetical protein
MELQSSRDAKTKGNLKQEQDSSLIPRYLKMKKIKFGSSVALNHSEATYVEVGKGCKSITLDTELGIYIISDNNKREIFVHSTNAQWSEPLT